jgi:hypothetical protein
MIHDAEFLYTLNYFKNLGKLMWPIIMVESKGRGRSCPGRAGCFLNHFLYTFFFTFPSQGHSNHYRIVFGASVIAKK